MCIEDIGYGLERELRTGDTNEFGHDETDGGKHGLSAVFELGLTEPVEPFGCSLRCVLYIDCVQQRRRLQIDIK